MEVESSVSAPPERARRCPLAGPSRGRSSPEHFSEDGREAREECLCLLLRRPARQRDEAVQHRARYRTGIRLALAATLASSLPLPLPSPSGTSGSEREGRLPSL